MEKKPVYLYDKFSKDFVHKTRMADTNCIKLSTKKKSELTKSSFVYRATNRWNLLPPSLRTINKLSKFKIELKTWIKREITI